MTKRSTRPSSPCVRPSRIPNAERIAGRWAKGHPELAVYLVDFAEATIQRVDKYAEDYDVDNPVRR